jgi:hypothetical protein
MSHGNPLISNLHKNLIRGKTMTRRDNSKIIRIVRPIVADWMFTKRVYRPVLFFPTTIGKIKNQYEVKVFGIFTDDLKRLREWLMSDDCPVVAMESTGIYWRPVHNVSGRKQRQRCSSGYSFTISLFYSGIRPSLTRPAFS